MNAKDTVKHLLMTQPSLFKNKLDAYFHLFITIGNGYQWIQGELINVVDENNNKVPEIQEAIENHLKKPFLSLKVLGKVQEKNKDEAEKVFLKDLDNRIEDIKRILHLEDPMDIDIKKIKVTSYSFEFELNPFCKIMQIPENITEGWKDAVKEFLDYLMNSKEKEIINFRAQGQNEGNLKFISKHLKAL